MINKQRTYTLLLFLLLGATSLSAQSVRRLIREGITQYETRAYSTAIETLQRAIDRRPNEEEALAYLAASLRELNQMEEAADKYALAMQNVARLEDKHILAFGQTLKALGRYDQAKQVFQVYAGRNPSVGNHFASSCDFAVNPDNLDTDFSVTNERINSSAADFGAAFYLDNVVFSSGRTDVQRASYNWDGQAKNQLFLATEGIDGYLQPPRFLKGTASTRGEGPTSFTAQGEIIAFTNNDFISGIRQDPGKGNELVLYVADMGANGTWFNEKAFVHNDRNSKTGYPSFTPDGSAMFFASDREGGYGGYDLYISYKEGETWSVPINLGPVVNSAGDEISPFFDGTDLYFSSNYHFGYGGYDVFKATERSGQWAEVNNAGKPINSPRDDYGFIFDPFKNAGYLTSNRPGGRGAEDIYKVSKASTSSVIIRVVDAANGSPVSFANLDFSACNLNLEGGNTRAVADSRGVYSFPIPFNIDCDVIVTSPGYGSKRYALNSSNLINATDLEIPLTREGQEYYGQIVSYTTQQPIPGIRVTARNLETGSTDQVTTDQNGTFRLGLQPNATYILIYSGAGYREVRRNVNTFNLTRDGLGVLSLYPSTFVDDTDPGPNPTPPQPPGTGVSQAGFSIQLGALSKNPPLSRYDNLSTLNGGDVYVKQSGGTYKVRYGVFPDRAAAQRFLGSVRNRGYRDAYIVAEDGVVIGGNSSGGSTTPPVTRPNPGTGTQAGSGTANPGASGGNYKIQLAALRNTRWFDGSSIANLGTIEDRKRGDLTIKLLGGFQTQSAAQQALTTVKRNGFPTAFIVFDNNGQLQRL